jgi:hypothetical protein
MKSVIPTVLILELYTSCQLYYFYEPFGASSLQRKVIISGIDNLLSPFLRRIIEQREAYSSVHPVFPCENMKQLLWLKKCRVSYFHFITTVSGQTSVPFRVGRLHEIYFICS